MWPAVSSAVLEHPRNTEDTVKRGLEVVEQTSFLYASLLLSMAFWGQANLGVPSPRLCFQGPAQGIMCLELLILRGSW